MNDATNRTGNWMTTFTGKQFLLLDPRSEDIDIEDIAHGLSRISRYNGATNGRCGYTVAQHSVYASWIVGRPYRLPALLHDASEAYAGDVITPLKKLLGKTYEDIEKDIMCAVADKFDFLWLADDVQEEVKWADKVLLATEVRDLIPSNALWSKITEKPMPFIIRPWTQAKAKRLFLERFEELKVTQ